MWQLQQRLDDSIDKGDMDGFVHSLHILSTNDKIDQKDKTLLEHISRRLKYKRGGKHGVSHQLTLASRPASQLRVPCPASQLCFLRTPPTQHTHLV